MSRNEPEIIVSESSLELYSRAAAAFMALAKSYHEKIGRFNVALSGGSTPLPLYGLLASAPFRERIKWESLSFFWSDERSVPPDHEESNYRAASAILLEKIDVEEGRIHRIEGELGEEAAPAYELLLKRAFGLTAGQFPVFDLMLLGMGTDGHTASLFPNSAAFDEEEKMVSAEYVKKLDSSRITLTPPVIKKASNIIFLVTGAEKAAVLKAILEGPYDAAARPAALTLRAEGRVRWFLDRPAASLLSGGSYKII